MKKSTQSTECSPHSGGASLVILGERNQQTRILFTAASTMGRVLRLLHPGTPSGFVSQDSALRPKALSQALLCIMQGRLAAYTIRRGWPPPGGFGRILSRVPDAGRRPSEGMRQVRGRSAAVVHSVCSLPSCDGRGLFVPKDDADTKWIGRLGSESYR